MVEINRFTQTKDWMFVRSEDMIADIGTQCVKDSVWINGF